MQTRKVGEVLKKIVLPTVKVGSTVGGIVTTNYIPRTKNINWI